MNLPKRAEDAHATLAAAFNTSCKQTWTMKPSLLYYTRGNQLILAFSISGV